MPLSLTQMLCRCCSKETHGRVPTGLTSQGRLLGISFMTLAELERWSLERDWGLRRKLELAQHLTRYAVLPVSRELCGKWARGFLRREEKRTSDPNGRRLDCSERPPLSGPPHYQQSRRLFGS